MKKLNFLSVLLLFITVFFAQNLSGQTYFSESFEGVWSGTPATAPSGWYNIHNAGGATQKYWAKNTWSGSAWSNTSYNAPPTTPTGAYDLSSVAWYNDYNASPTQKDQLTTNNIDLSVATIPRVTFYLAISANSSLTLKLRGSNDGGATWADIQTITKPGTAWTKVTVAIPATYKVSNARFGLEVTATLGSYDVWVDKFSVEETPVGPMNGTYTINNTLPTTSPMVNDGTGNFNSFTSAINYLNEVGIAGSVTFNVASGLTFTEDCPVITATGTSSNSITFQKSGSTANPVIKPTGTSATTDAGIKIAGGDYIIFDGIDITIATGSLVEYGYYLYGTSATNGAQNNTIKNSSISLNKLNTSSIGIYSNANLFTLSNATGANSNNKFYNLSISNVYAGMYLYGYSSTYPDLSSEIGITGSGTATTIGGATANDIGNGTTTTYGIKTNYQSGIKIFNTEVRNIKGLSTTEVDGIWLANTYGTNNIYNNKIHDVGTTWTTTASLVYGLKLDIASGNTANVYNNTVNNLTHGTLATASSTQIVIGIAALTGSGTSNFYNNSVRIDLTDANSSSTAFYGSLATYTTKNNIFANFSTAGITSKRYAYYSSSGTITESNNNILYINQSGTNNFTGYRFADYKSLAQFAAAISTTAPSNGAEAGSSEANPTFNTNALTFSGNNPAIYSGTTIASPAITIDIAGNTRDISRPTIGAYEDLTYSLTDNSAPVLSNVTITGSGTTSTSISVALNDNSNSANNAIVRLWYRIGTSGAYTGIDADSKPSGSMNGTYAWSTSLPIGQYNFYITARDDQGAGTGIWANPIWANSFAGFNVADPPNLIANPDAAANVRSFSKMKNLAGGTYDVGSTSTLVNLTAVANELNNSMLQGNVVYELTSNYDGTTGETFPITFNQFATDGLGSWTVTIRVKSGAGARTTSGSYAGNLIALNGTDRISFDGREGGSGLTKAWTISNTNTSGTAICFINDATFNLYSYCILQGAHTATTTNGVVLFSTTTGTTGNDNNTIDNCDIKNAASDNTSNLPLNAIYASGTSGKENDNNTISNCNIYNFWNASNNTYGVNISSYNTSYTINSNNFYQGATRTATAGSTHNGIYINNASGNNFIITNNNIGGSSANCGGTAWTVGGLNTNKFQAMYLNVGTTITSSVQGNKISNFDFTTSSGTTTGAGSFCGINIAAGNVNVGNINANFIGSSSVDNIKLTASNAALLVGINSASIGSVNISNNSIYGLASVGSLSSTGAYLTGIQTSGTLGNYTIHNNIIGSTTIANSLRSGTSGTSGATYVKGIDNSATGSIVISQNTIGNLASLGSNSSSSLRGINTIAGTNSVTINTIRDLYTISANTGVTTSSSLIGISQTSTNSGQLVSQNTIFGLSNNHSTASVVVAGIYHVCNNTDAEVISRNTIYNLEANNATAAIYGIYSGGSSSVATNVKNNMIRLGYKKDGTDLTFGCFMAGVYDAQGIHNYYHNSIYIGGANVVSSSLNTYAFISSITSGARSFQNNIFVNARSNASGSGKNYAVRVAGSGVNPTGLTINYNDYFTSGTGAVYGYYGADITNQASWRTAVGQDANSFSGDPQFIAPSAVTPDLHIQAAIPTSIEATGIAIGNVTDDFDGEIRSSLSPTDIGADAGNFISSDIIPPTITYTALSNTASLNNRVITVTITDPSGIPLTGNGLPMLYWKINSGTYSGVQGVSIGYNQYSFSFGDGVVSNDIVSYYIVAHDNAAIPNIISNPFTGASVFSAYPPACSVPPTTPNTYTILKSFSGVYNVGATQTYTSLTNTGGLFAAINAGVVVGDITVNITSNITESGNNALNQFIEEGAGNYPMTIQSDGSLRVLSNLYSIDGSASYMIPINGADRVTIDGGVGKLLTFRAWSATRAYTATVIGFYNGATNDTLRNCIIESNESSNTIGAITIGSGNNQVAITNNDIRDSRAGTYNASPNTGLYSNTATNTLTITNNNIYNWTRSSAGTSYGLNLLAVADGCIISGNNFFMESSISCQYTQIAINIGLANGHIISDNYIGGQSALCGGSSWTNSGGYTVTGIQLATGTLATTQVVKNTIQNISLTSIGSSAFYGIYVTAGKVAIGSSGNGNIIGHNTDANKGIKIAGNTSSNAMIYSLSTDISGIDFNTIANIKQSNTTSTAGLKGIIYSAGNPTVTNNILKSFSTASTNTSTTSSSALIGIATTSSGLNQMIAKNIITDFSASTTSASSVRILGVLLSGATSDGMISKNNISNFKNTCTSSTGGYITGILVNSGYEYVIDNNSISLQNGSNTNPINIQGIWDNAGTSGVKHYFYNSINIGGSTTSGTLNSYAFYRSLNTSVELKNNILSNLRTGGTAKHYSVVVNANSNFTNDYNDFFASNLSNIGSVNGGTTALNFSTWKSTTLQDANSFSVNPNYTSDVNLQPVAGSYLIGWPIATVTADINENTRNIVSPSIGAYEEVVNAKSLNVKVYLEGLFDLGLGMMRAVQDENGDHYGPTIADNITIELHSSTSPYELMFAFSDINLSTNGNCNINLVQSFTGSYYIVVKHRNSIETWSASPVNFLTSTTNYDFTTSADKAFGDNLKELEPGVYAIFGGDLNQDGFVDITDLSDMDNDLTIGTTGYNVYDLNGDGYVDITDLSDIDNNLTFGIYKITP